MGTAPNFPREKSGAVPSFPTPFCHPPLLKGLPGRCGMRAASAALLLHPPAGRRAWRTYGKHVPLLLYEGVHCSINSRSQGMEEDGKNAVIIVIAFILTTGRRFKIITPCLAGDQKFRIPGKEKRASWQKKSVQRN